MPAQPLEALNVHAAPTDGPRRRYLSILFSDLSESTRLASRLEAEEYLDLLARLGAVYHAVVARHGGTVAQISGDGMLALFGYPEAREGDGRRAVEAALELDAAVALLGTGGRGEGPLRLHSGIHAGLVLLQSGDQCRGRFELLGCATNIASRLCSVAAPGEILVSEETLGPERHLFATSARSRLRLRGADEPVLTLAVTGRAVEARSEPAPFVGRDAELAALAADFAAARVGGPRITIVEGPPGVGKTRLVEEFLRRAGAEGCAIHRGNCESSAEPLRPFLEIARSLLGVAGDDPPDVDTAACALAGIDPGLADLAPALCRLLSPRRQSTPGDAAALAELIAHAGTLGPLVLFVDDWHAADDASREMMALLRTLEKGAVLVLATARPDPRIDGLSEGLERLRLAPLTAAETAAAVAGLLPSADPFTVEEIGAASGGNPLFIEELCHAMAAGERHERPQGCTPWLANLIESRVSRLPPAAAELLRVAAVIGNSVPAWLLEAIAGRGEGDPLVRSLAEADFLYPGERPGTLRFKHGITREVIYDSVGLHQRRGRHADIAAALRARASAAGEDEPVEALAYHFGAADELNATVLYAEQAGDKAMAASALDRAQGYYRAALDALERLEDSDENAARWDRIAQRFGLAGVFDPARDQLQVFERAIERAGARRDPVALAWAEYWLGYINYGLGEPETASDHCSRALESALGTGDDRLVVQIRATLGQAKAAACDYRGALLLLDEAIEVKRRHRTGQHASVGFAYSLASKAFVLGDMGRFAEAEAGFSEAMDAVRGADHEVEGSVLCKHAGVYLWQGRLEEALRCAEEAERVAVRVHSVYLYAMSRALGSYALWSLEAGDGPIETLVEATGWLEAKGRGLYASLPYGWLADALARRGDPSGSRRYAARALRRAEKGDRLGEAMAWRAMARSAAARGARETSHRCLERAEAAGAARAAAHEAAATRLCAAEIAAASGDTELVPRLDAMARAEAEARRRAARIRCRAGAGS
ncbi:MAG TPA: AAA family ATPase [Allosphingosinicella sp.]|jgi:class 3 adenylate cyclase